MAGLDIDMIAPSHGLMWRSHIPDIVAEYVKWSDHQTEPRAMVVYDTMWHSTEKMAYKLLEGLTEAGVTATIWNLKTNHISDIMTELIRARAVLIGSPTLNGEVLPSMAAFLTYLKGLRPRKRTGLAFGSYGWSPRSREDIEAVMRGLGWDVPEPGISINYVPDPEELEAVREAGRRLGATIGR